MKKCRSEKEKKNIIIGCKNLQFHPASTNNAIYPYPLPLPFSSLHFFSPFHFSPDARNQPSPVFPPLLVPGNKGVRAVNTQCFPIIPPSPTSISPIHLPPSLIPPTRQSREGGRNHPSICHCLYEVVWGRVRVRRVPLPSNGGQFVIGSRNPWHFHIQWVCIYHF